MKKELKLTGLRKMEERRIVLELRKKCGEFTVDEVVRSLMERMESD